MGQMIQNMQTQIKRSSQSMVLFSLKLLSGLLLGLVLAISGETVFGYGSFSFWFVVVLFCGVFLKISKPWSFGALMIYNLVCVLVGVLLRMYVLIAPGN